MALYIFSDCTLIWFETYSKPNIETGNGAIHICRAVTHPTRNQPEVKDTKTRSRARTIGLSALAVPHLPQVKADEFVFGGRRPLSYT